MSDRNANQARHRPTSIAPTCPYSGVEIAGHYLQLMAEHMRVNSLQIVFAACCSLVMTSTMFDGLPTLERPLTVHLYVADHGYATGHTYASMSPCEMHACSVPMQCLLLNPSTCRSATHQCAVGGSYQLSFVNRSYSITLITSPVVQSATFSSTLGALHKHAAASINHQVLSITMCIVDQHGQSLSCL